MSQTLRMRDVIETFRQNEGKVGGSFAGRPLLLLHHVGRKTGIARVSPLMYQQLEGRLAIFASRGGSPVDPHWYRNLMLQPDTTIEIGGDTVAVHAREVHGPERTAIWERQKREWPQFDYYERKTSRAVIPVIVLEPR